MVVVIEGMNDLKKRLEDAGDALVVIDFFATWCGPCKIIAPQFEELSKKHSSVIFLKVDVDENDEISATYEVSSMPTFVFIKKGEVVHQFAGASANKLIEAIEKYQ
ncbi:hypothetical protein PV325_010553 [Microctonus aethiopoides]|uniref:Thioredoxin domain-containing protein n=1 Tax=Microctonus aethiopoides TaxID=144406 RepID=A0AA39C4X4_9HYME|nr:hypothetical protein PV325_010553 [Microctonus aethiopoides]KAK0157990.1 hypothetical protein PV328_011659 [Microctonus aethiopoides]